MAEDYRSEAFKSCQQIKILREIIWLKEHEIRELTHKAALAKQEIDRLGMSGEDSLAKYLATWAVSDERRFHLSEANRALAQERKARKNLMRDFEASLTAHDKLKNEQSSSQSLLEEKLQMLQTQNHSLSLKIADLSSTNDSLTIQLDEMQAMAASSNKDAATSGMIQAQAQQIQS